MALLLMKGEAVRGNPWELALSFHPMNSRNWTQVFRVGSKSLTHWDIVMAPKLIFMCVLYKGKAKFYEKITWNNENWMLKEQLKHVEIFVSTTTTK